MLPTSAKPIKVERVFLDFREEDPSSFLEPIPRHRLFYTEGFHSLIEDLVRSLDLAADVVRTLTNYSAAVDLESVVLVIFDLTTGMARSVDDPKEARSLIVIQRRSS